MKCIQQNARIVRGLQKKIRETIYCENKLLRPCLILDFVHVHFGDLI